MPYQVNLVANDVGFTEEALEARLNHHAPQAQPPLAVARDRNESLQLILSGAAVVTLAPAGAEPYDYLLVDFAETPGWDQGPQLQVVARIAEDLDLAVLELDSSLEYTPAEWANSRSTYHSPDPNRREEARRLELDREIEFFDRRGLPYDGEERALLYRAISNSSDAELEQQAQTIRDRKKREDRPRTPIKGRKYTDRPSGSILKRWFGR